MSALHSMTVSLCRHPSCNTITGNGLCAKHQRTAWSRDALQTLKPRVQTMGNRLAVMPPSRVSGYRIRGRELQRIREVHLRAHPLCVRCMDRGMVTPALELDHIVALTNGGTDTPENRQGLCGPCHAEKTREDLKG